MEAQTHDGLIRMHPLTLRLQPHTVERYFNDAQAVRAARTGAAAIFIGIFNYFVYSLLSRR